MQSFSLAPDSVIRVYDKAGNVPKRTSTPPVLVTGGCGPTAIVADVEIYSPASAVIGVSRRGLGGI